MAVQVKKQQVAIKQIVCLLIFSVVLGTSDTTQAGCADKYNPVGAACHVDADCRSNFCDLG
ncbi:MAG: hypothetical protein QNK24_14175, partial [Desulfuromusa sp.]|nr:hypothetical protein [Desulfuromusa sp.]